MAEEKGEKPGFGRRREVYEAAWKVAFRIRGVGDVPFQAEFLSSPDRRRLRDYLVEVRGWADGLLEQMDRPNPLASGGPGKAEPVEEKCHGPDDKKRA